MRPTHEKRRSFSFDLRVEEEALNWDFVDGLSYHRYHTMLHDAITALRLQAQPRKIVERPTERPTVEKPEEDFFVTDDDFVQM